MTNCNHKEVVFLVAKDNTFLGARCNKCGAVWDVIELATLIIVFGDIIKKYFSNVDEKVQ